MDRKFIYHHLGLGDCIMCNGLVRYFASKNDVVTTFCKPHYVETVRHMYRDLNNVMVLGLDDADVMAFMNTIPPTESVVVGHVGAEWNDIYENQKAPVDQQIKLDWMFFHQAGLPLDLKWVMFHIKRDHNREMAVFNRFKEKYGIEEGKYVFVHDTSQQAYDGFPRPGVGGEIDHKYIEDKSLPILRPENVKFNMLDYAYLIEHAAELHMINSSFYNLADLIPTNGKLFYHIYPRPYDCITSRKPWVKLWGDVKHD